MQTTHTVKMKKDGSTKTFKMVMGVEGAKLGGKWRGRDQALDEMTELLKKGWKVVQK